MKAGSPNGTAPEGVQCQAPGCAHRRFYGEQQKPSGHALLDGRPAHFSCYWRVLAERSKAPTPVAPPPRLCADGEHLPPGRNGTCPRCGRLVAVAV